MEFYLGAHMPGWLGKHDIPMMVSRRRLFKYKALPRARTNWVLDSGGFTELSMYGEWTIPPHKYIAEVRRYYDGIGSMVWAAGQDWMCEPWITAKTGKTVLEHQRLTVGNYLDLKGYSPELPIIPTLQGWDLNDYLRHAQMYEEAGVDLRSEPTVGLGSVCRRQATKEIGEIVATVAAMGIKLHGFGCKTGAIKQYGNLLHSADSMAWCRTGSYENRPCPVYGHKSCSNCWHFASEWRDRVVNSLPGTAPIPSESIERVDA